MLNKKFKWLGIQTGCLVLLLGAGGIVFSAGQVASEEEEAEGSYTLEGERLELAITNFQSKCAVCHGAEGNSPDPPMNLVDEIWRHGYKLTDIEKTIREGVPDTMMQAQKDNLTADEIADLAKYVKMLAKKMHAKMEEPEREVATALTDRVASQLPDVSGADVEGRANFVDDYIFGKMKTDGVPHAKLSTDTEFMRRVYLDLWGRLPDAEQVRKFAADEDPEKRNKLIDHLLGLDYMEKAGHDDYKGPWLVEEPFLSKWTYFFGDLFRNGPQGNAEQFREYVNLFLKYNLPYDYVVREMLTATAITGKINGATGFLLRNQVDGLRCADVMHEDTCDEIALNATKIFLGVNMECVSCHDGARHIEDINLWLSQVKRVEFWRQAAFFSNIRIFRATLANQDFALLDGPSPRPDPIWQGKIDGFRSTSPPTEFGGLGYRLEAPSVLRPDRNRNVDVYPEYLLTKKRPDRGVNPRHEFARMLTEDFQFARATVNLIWSKLMTVGIVDPPFEFDLARQDPDNPPPSPWTIQPSHPELLNVLAKDFQKHHFDLRHLMRTICRSQAYQLSSQFGVEYKSEWDRYYARKLVRRLSAEEIYDGIVKSTNVFGNDVEYVMDLGVPPGNGELKRFLAFFGQSNRTTSAASTDSSIIQASLMLNSDLVKRKVLVGTEESRVSLLLNHSPPLSNEELVEELFLWTLCRYPTEKERKDSIRHVENYRDKGVEDLQWALLNKLEFIVNY